MKKSKLFVLLVSVALLGSCGEEAASNLNPSSVAVS
jgi:hypothetical protein